MINNRTNTLKYQKYQFNLSKCKQFIERQHDNRVEFDAELSLARMRPSLNRSIKKKKRYRRRTLHPVQEPYFWSLSTLVFMLFYLLTETRDEAAFLRGGTAGVFPLCVRPG